jgi:hypothetical protein
MMFNVFAFLMYMVGVVTTLTGLVMLLVQLSTISFALI